MLREVTHRLRWTCCRTAPSYFHSDAGRLDQEAKLTEPFICCFAYLFTYTLPCCRIEVTAFSSV